MTDPSPGFPGPYRFVPRASSAPFFGASSGFLGGVPRPALCRAASGAAHAGTAAWRRGHGGTHTNTRAKLRAKP